MITHCFVSLIRFRSIRCVASSILLFLPAFQFSHAQESTAKVDIGCDLVFESKGPDYDPAALAELLTYPELARQKGMEGEVVVRVKVGPRGELLDAVIHRSSDTIFEANVLDAVRKLHYVPAVQGGYPISAWLPMTVVFKLSDSADSAISPFIGPRDQGELAIRGRGKPIGSVRQMVVNTP